MQGGNCNARYFLAMFNLFVTFSTNCDPRCNFVMFCKLTWRCVVSHVYLNSPKFWIFWGDLFHLQTYPSKNLLETFFKIMWHRKVCFNMKLNVRRMVVMKYGLCLCIWNLEFDVLENLFWNVNEKILNPFHAFLYKKKSSHKWDILFVFINHRINVKQVWKDDSLGFGTPLSWICLEVSPSYCYQLFCRSGIVE